MCGDLITSYQTTKPHNSQQNFPGSNKLIAIEVHFLRGIHTLIHLSSFETANLRPVLASLTYFRLLFIIYSTRLSHLEIKILVTIITRGFSQKSRYGHDLGIGRYGYNL